MPVFFRFRRHPSVEGLAFGLLCAAVLCLGLRFFSAAEASASEDRPIFLVHIHDTINPGLQDFIEHAIRKAEEAGAECLILELDTPGGLVTAMRGIVKAMMNAKIPIVVFVSPSGAQAASAGVFITAAADVAAMAPGTNIGAAHPVTAPAATCRKP